MKKVSFYLNILIFLFVLFATISMLMGFYFMGEEKLLTSTRLGAFKFFTVDSNVFMGIVALIFSIYEYRLINDKKEIPKAIHILKFMATIGVMVTFFVTLIYLAPFYEKGFLALYKNSNLFFHLIIPILSFISFTFESSKCKLKFKDTLYGLIPFALYAIFYVTNILIHEKTIEFDFYNFTNGGKNSIIIAILIIFLFIYLVDLLMFYIYMKGGSHETNINK